MTRWSFSVAGLVGLLLLAVTPASADSLTFYLQSQHPNIVNLEFYSQDRDVAWPGGGEVYIMDDYDTHSYPLSCRTGEQICFGAWVRGDSNVYWGAGIDSSQYCDSCCYICGKGDTEVVVLNP